MTLWSALLAQAETTPDKLAVAAPDATLTYAGLCDAAVQASHRLAREHMVEAGDRIAFLGLNGASQIVLLFAAARAGWMLSPLNWRLAEEELSWIIADAAPSLIVADEQFAQLANAIAGERPVVPAGADLWAGEEADCRDATETDPECPVLLAYTSGATGRPKGAVLSQRALVANAAMSQDMHALKASDHVLTTLPMFHVGGLNIQTLPALLYGASVTILDRFEPGSCLEAITRLRPTLTLQVPATLAAMISHQMWAKTDLSCLRLIATGSTDVPVALIEAVHARGVPVIQIYGATETGPVIVYQHGEEAFSHVGSIGRPGPGVDVRLVDRAGTPVALNEVGEIHVRSPTLAAGYWNDRGTAEAYADGWFRTGDMARCDEDGFLWFADRLKNVIISGGENIYPAELERILAQIPGIREAAVVGTPDERWGAVPIAAVVCDRELQKTDVQDAFEGQLARFKRPKEILFFNKLPRNALGKVKVDALRAMVADQIAVGAADGKN